MRGVNLTDLASLPNDANLVALAEIDPTEWNAHRKRLQAGLNSALAGLQDLESSYAGSGEPTRKTQGKKYYDSDADVWKLYRSAAGTPAVLLDPTKAYLQPLTTPGTGTLKAGGPINVNADQVSFSGVTGDLMTYTVPAATLGSDQETLGIVAIGTVGSAADIRALFGATSINSPTKGASNMTKYAAKYWIVRTGPTSQKFGCNSKFNRDDSSGDAITKAVSSGISAETLGSDVVFKLLKTVASGTAAEELMITRLLQ